MTVLRIAQWLNRTWVKTYTAGLTPSQKTERRAEVESDMFEHEALYLGPMTSSSAVSAQVLSRTVRGAAFDVMWRWTAGRDGESVIQRGESPPLPFFTMWFVGSVILFSSGASLSQLWVRDLWVGLAMLSAVGAALMWWGLYLASHRIVGPMLVAGGAIVVAASLYWTIVAPFMAVAAGIAGVRRAERLATGPGT